MANAIASDRSNSEIVIYRSIMLRLIYNVRMLLLQQDILLADSDGYASPCCKLMRTQPVSKNSLARYTLT